MEAHILNDIECNKIFLKKLYNNYYIKYKNNPLKIFIKEAKIDEGIYTHKYSGKPYIRVCISPQQIFKLVEIEEHICSTLNIKSSSFKSIISNGMLSMKIPIRYNTYEIEVIDKDGNMGISSDLINGMIVDIEMELRNIWSIDSKNGIINYGRKFALRNNE